MMLPPDSLLIYKGLLPLNAKKRAEYYLDQLICYLRENDTDYPLFRDGDDCCTNLRYDGYGNSGIILDDEDEFYEYVKKKGLTREDLE